MCISTPSMPAPVEVAAPPPPPPKALEKAPQQQAVGRRKPGAVNTAGMAGGSLLTGPAGIQASALNTGGSTLLGG